jgi:hypothetical protein
MWIKNTATRPVTVEMVGRTLVLPPGHEELVSAEEVLDPVLRQHLQVRSVSIVRPATPEEEAALSGSSKESDTE